MTLPYGTDYFTGAFVSTLAHGLLATAAATLASPPTVQYVHMGQPAADGCDQLVVWVDSFHLVRPRKQTALGGGGMSEERSPLEPQGGLPAVQFNVQLLRCGAPTVSGELQPSNPSAADLDTFGTNGLTDGWSLYRGVLAAWQSETLFGVTNPVPKHHTLLSAMKPYGPEAGVYGWLLPVKASLY